MGTYSKLLTKQSPTPQDIERPEKTKSSSVTRKTTQKVAQVLDNPRQVSSENSREISREFPTRDDIQEFSFSLRDELKVKVQAEVPHQWQTELEELARTLNVKKLELYRFIIGDFLGKVKRNKSS